uniref:Myosin tail domain-containing protein n=1 Tax=Labrus bergylta TaxID=56723 RepID=A0A3Q3H0S6_9LABR
EITDLTDQLSDGGKSVHELQKAKKKIEMEKEELQGSLEESEAALEVEETKVLRLQLELSQAKGDLERRLQEKEEEAEAARKSHQRALESLQASLDVELKGRAEGMKLKKKLESDINELELQVDLLTKNNAELSKSSKKMQQQIKELQAQLEEEVRSHEEHREDQAAVERRCGLLISEGEETRAVLESAERARKGLETELQEANEKYSDLNNQCALSGRRKLEVDLQTLQQEHEELQGELRGSTDKSKKATSELARVGEELRLEQEHALHLERVKKGLEAQIKDMSGRLDEAEQMALKGGKKIIQKLEGKEEQANMNMAKYRKTVNELDDAEERADIAESALTKIRTKNRGSFGKGYSSGYSTPFSGLVRSPSSVGSEGRGEKILNDDEESVSSLIPAYLNSLKKLMVD